jgi:hypothetical protein
MQDNTKKEPWYKLASFKLDSVPLLSAGEQTKGSWARELENLKQVPDCYKEFYNHNFNNAETFPYSVLTPNFGGFLRRENEKLICKHESKIFVLENVSDEIKNNCFQVQDISYIETGSILLKAWMGINGFTSEGIYATETLKFNTVTDYMFHPFIEEIRSSNSDQNNTGIESELAKFDYLSEIDFKFMNYAKKTMQSGEKMIEHVYQPEIRSRIISIFGKSLYRTSSSTHISILTEKMLYIIKESGHRGTNNNRRFGGIWNYIPVNKIHSTLLAKKSDGLVELTINFSDGEQIKSLFSTIKKSEIDQFLVSLNSLKAQTNGNSDQIGH